MLLAERIIPVGIMARYQVTHYTGDFYGISIALAIRSINILRKRVQM